MNLQRLRYFLAVAEELHFGRAAERLRMAQPPLSQQIRQLEGELEVQLFDRTTRSVELTAAGALLRAEAEKVIQAAESAERVMEEFRNGLGGVLRLAFVDSASFEVMPKFLREFRSRFPNVRHDLQIMSTANQLDALSQGKIDMGIGRVPAETDDIVSTMFLDEPLYVAVGPDYDHYNPAMVRVRDIAGCSMIGFDRRVSPRLFDELERLFSVRHGTYAPDIVASEYTTMIGLVASGEGVAVVPNGVRTFSPGGVRYIRIADEGATMPIYALTRDDEPLRVVANALKTVIELF